MNAASAFKLPGRRRPDSKTLALDEMIPRDGERYLRMANLPHRRLSRRRARCLGKQRHPEHQRKRRPPYLQRQHAGRSGLPSAPQCVPRALKLAQLVNIELGGEKLKAPVSGKLLDISATGCKLRFEGDISERLQLGQVYDRFIAALPFGSMTTSVELRYYTSKRRSTPPSPACASTT